MNCISFHVISNMERSCWTIRMNVLPLTVFAVIGFTCILFYNGNYNSLKQQLAEITTNTFVCMRTEIDWSTIEVSTMKGEEITKYFGWSNSSSCGLVHDFGGKMLKYIPRGLDGQKAVCLDPTIAPRPDRCLVYSFGINNEWSFDEAMAEYGCQVYSFDPSMNLSDHDHSANIHFYNMALDSKDVGKKNRTLSSIYDLLTAHHGQNFIDYLKMDVEFAEWRILPQINPAMWSIVKQLSVEIHLPTDQDLDFYRKLVGVLMSLEREAGMRRFDSKYNPWCPDHIPALNYTGPVCFEIAWYNSEMPNLMSSL